MKTVTVTFVIGDQHNIDDYRLRAIEGELKRVQESSDHGLVYVGHHVEEIPKEL